MSTEIKNAFIILFAEQKDESTKEKPKNKNEKHKIQRRRQSVLYEITNTAF